MSAGDAIFRLPGDALFGAGHRPSPDGRLVAFFTDAPDSWPLYVVAEIATARRVATRAPARASPHALPPLPQPPAWIATDILLVAEGTRLRAWRLPDEILYEVAETAPAGDVDGPGERRLDAFALSPGRDAIVVAFAGARLAVHDAATGARQRLLAPPGAPTWTDVRFRGDGEEVLARRGDAPFVHRWEVRTGAARGGTGLPPGTRFDVGGGPLLPVESERGPTYTVDPFTGARLPALEIGEGEVAKVRGFSADGARAFGNLCEVDSDIDQCAMLGSHLAAWDTATGRRVHGPWERSGWIEAAATDPSGRIVVARTDAGTIAIDLDSASDSASGAASGARSGAALHDPEIPSGVALSTDGSRLALAYTPDWPRADRRRRIEVRALDRCGDVVVIDPTSPHDLRAGVALLWTFEGTQGYSVDDWTPIGPPFLSEHGVYALDPSGRYAYAGSDPAGAWDLRTGEKTALAPIDAYPPPVVSPDLARIAATEDSALTLYDARTGEVVAALDEDGVWGPQPAFAPDGSLLAASLARVDDPSLIVVLDAATGEASLRFDTDGFVDCLAFTADGRHLVVASGGRLLVRDLCDLSGGTWLASPDGGHGAPIRALALSADGSRAASLARDGSVAVFAMSAMAPICDVAS